MKNFQEKVKNIIFAIVLFCAKLYWRIFKPKTYGSRVLLVCNNKFFLVKPRGGDYWNLPGGGINRNEKPELAAMRELYEETGLKIESIDYLLGRYTSRDEAKRDNIYVYIKKVDSNFIENGVLNLEIELQDVKWFGYNNLPETITKRTKYRIDEYRAGFHDIDGLWGEKNI